MSKILSILLVDMKTTRILPYGDIEQYLATALPEVECRQIVQQILKGLRFMHDHDFAHRDLKPNVSMTMRNSAAGIRSGS